MFTVAALVIVVVICRRVRFSVRLANNVRLVAVTIDFIFMDSNLIGGNTSLIVRLRFEDLPTDNSVFVSMI
jgi:hypothetical protein